MQQKPPNQGRIPDGKHASAFSSCGNTRKTAARPDEKRTGKAIKPGK